MDSTPTFKVVAVTGLKGGVGKSLVAVNLALEMKRRGFKVGLLDADVDSPYLVEIAGITDKVGLEYDRRMIPVDYAGVPVMSFALWVPDAFQGASMQGSMHTRWISDALSHTNWGPIDVLVTDLPAGSSDEHMTVRKLAGSNFLGLIVVGLPNLYTTLERVYNTAAYSQTRILGVVENMAGEAFGSGGVERFCKSKGLKFLGSIPLDQRIRLNNEAHRPELPTELARPIRAAADAVQSAQGIKAVTR